MLKSIMAQAISELQRPPNLESNRLTEIFQVNSSLQIIAAENRHENHCTTYRVPIPGSNKSIIIDGGSFDLLDQKDLNNVIAVLITHHHLDHVIGLPQLPRQTSLFANPTTFNLMRSGDQDALASFLYPETPCPQINNPCNSLLNAQTLHLGEVEVTPYFLSGHSACDTIYLINTGPHTFVAAGDLIWGGYSPRLGSNIPAWERSLDFLKDVFNLHPEAQLLTGHYFPQIGKPLPGKAVVDKAIESYNPDNPKTIFGGLSSHWHGRN